MWDVGFGQSCEVASGRVTVNTDQTAGAGCFDYARYRARMSELGAFSRGVLRRPLYGYQLEPARAVLQSVVNRKGEEFLLVMARQSGKNELVAQLLVYLLNVLQRSGGQMVYAALGDGVGRGLRRLEERLDNEWNRDRWKREGRPARRTLGRASVVFVSSHPQAHARGETAHHLLVVDELQDQDAAHLQAVFQPMRAANNATAVYLGTVRTTYDALWRKKEELERLQARDGLQRVFMVGPEAVCEENAAYERFLAREIKKLGRKHPPIASEYFLEPLDEESGLFPRRRVALMRGRHSRQCTVNSEHGSVGGELFVATLDVAGIAEAATGLEAGLGNAGRDYTACTIFRVRGAECAMGNGKREHSIADSPFSMVNGPVFEAVDLFVDQGSQHFKEHADGQPSLARQLAAFLAHWQVAYLVGDATGVGEGLLNWLAAAFGTAMGVTAFKFTRRSKAQLGTDFLALVETNRFKYFRVEQEYDDAWWFYEQARHCVYELEAGRPMETHLRWFVPQTARVSTPTGRKAVHDDRLLSAALVAEVDRLIREGKIKMGRAESAVIKGRDPLEGLTEW